jgi:hypothetical protein
MSGFQVEIETEVVWVENLLNAYRVYSIQHMTRGLLYPIDMFLDEHALGARYDVDGSTMWTFDSEDVYNMIVTKWGKEYDYD